MADVRSLLRQQRAMRRIEHPHAVYTEAGRLLCTLCREQIKADSLWDKHLQSEGHRYRQRDRDAAAEQPASHAAAATQQQKRKLDVDDGGDGEIEEAVRRKRSKQDMAPAHANGSSKEPAARGTAAEQSKEATLTPPTLTPPSLTRRASTTPSQGVELQIPSRPATPSRREASSSSTPGGGVPSAPPPPPQQQQQQQQAPGPATASLPRRQASSLAAGDENKTGPAAAQVDESEWAAFEAEVAAESAAPAPYDPDAVISAPAMTAEESAAATAAAKTPGLPDGSRKAQADVDIEEEREDAKRAMENEFEDMQQLEQRVKRLRERREALRKRGESLGEVDPGPAAAAAAVAAAHTETVSRDEEEKEVDAVGADKVNGAEDGAEDDDEDEDDDDDDWDGFRFRAL